MRTEGMDEYYESTQSDIKGLEAQLAQKDATIAELLAEVAEARASERKVLKLDWFEEAKKQAAKTLAVEQALVAAREREKQLTRLAALALEAEKLWTDELTDIYGGCIWCGLDEHDESCVVKDWLQRIQEAKGEQ